MSRALLLTVRPEDDAAADEYLAVLEASGLSAGRLSQHRLDRDELGPLDDVDAVIVGGSPFNVTAVHKSADQRRAEADLTRLAHTAVDRRLPVLFTCYGIGVFASALGGSVGLDNGEPVGAVGITVTDAAATDHLLAGLPDQFDAFVGHKESVERLPEDAVLLASSAACPVQMFRVGESAWATQFHPEPTPAQLMQRARVYQHHGYFPVHELAEVERGIAASSVEWPRRILERFATSYC